MKTVLPLLNMPKENADKERKEMCFFWFLFMMNLKTFKQNSGINIWIQITIFKTPKC